jgi:hypothetical protein
MEGYRHIARMGWIIGICVGLVPFGITAISGISPAVTLALIGSTLLIEYGAVLPGLALGVPPVILIIVMTSIASGVILASLELFDYFSARSEKLSRFLERVWESRAGQLVHRYGVWGLIPGIMIAGFYVCPALSWIFAWERRIAVAMMIGAFILSSVVVLLLSLGVLTIFL